MSMNVAQRTAVATTLEQLEQAVAKTEQLLDNPPGGITFATDVDWDEATVCALRELCARVRSQIAGLVDSFGLPVDRLSGRGVVVAAMSSAWVNLADSRPKALRRYGDVDPALNETLAPRLEQLMNLVMAIQRVVSQ
jgi:hypothetical protein